MWKDPIVEEVRKLRDEYAATFNYDLKAIFDDVVKRQRRGKNKLVSFQPRNVIVKEKSA